MAWRAFIGEPDHRSKLDVTGTWDEARDALTAWLKEELNWITGPDPDLGSEADPCPWCVSYLTDALTGLDTTPSGSPFRGDYELDEIHLSAV